MYHKDFYPSTQKLVQRMIRPLGLGGAYVLDGSAGDGQILDGVRAATDGTYRQAAHLYACEIVPELRAVLRDKGYTIVADDFLQYQPRLHFTHILINPPFSRAEEHLLHAWNILYCGEIVCILPNNILDGDSEKEKTIQAIIKDHGSAERVGRAFAGAARPTQVEVSIVRLHKQADESIKFEWDLDNDATQPDFVPEKDLELLPGSYIDGLLATYNAALAHYAEYAKLRREIAKYTHPLSHGYKDSNPLVVADAKESPLEMWNEFFRVLTENAWEKILDHPQFQSILTKRARDMMHEFKSRQARMDFNAQNIWAMFSELEAKGGELLMAAVLDAFDTMTAYHTENRIYFEGWKSDKAWKVNTRVVLPGYVSFSLGYFRLDYDRKASLDDIDRALCVVTGRRFDDILTVSKALAKAFDGQRCEPGVTASYFFSKIRFFKKGTLHLYFRDEQVLADFNLMSARGRGWLPPAES